MYCIPYTLSLVFGTECKVKEYFDTLELRRETFNKNINNHFTLIIIRRAS